MLLADLKNKISRKTIKIASLAVFLLGFSTLVFAQDTIPPSPDIPTTDLPVPQSAFQGLVRGFAWMGTGIQNPNSSEGGGGWLRFNCVPGDCSNNWGVTADMDANSSTRGYLRGQAWSNNYGWLDFSDDNVQSCWEANQGETFAGPAKILFPSGKIVGWGKFLAGDDFPDDGWDGCVSFSGVDYGVSVDLVTGVVSGWAWGSSVVGWISFTNPECPFCDVTIVLNQVLGCTNPLATNYNPLATVDDGSCRFGPPVRGCTDPVALNYNPLATIDDGSCRYGPPVRGCTNPLAINYNPLATVDDGSCRFAGGGPNPTLTLTVNPDTFTVGQPNVGSQYIAGPALTPITWTSNNPSAFVPNSCQGTFLTVSGGLTSTAILPGWTGSRANPNSSLTNVNVPMAATATAGTAFRFTITCGLVSGGTLSASDQINMIDPIVSTEPPLLWLHITNPNSNPPDGSLLRENIAPWSASSSGTNVTLEWLALNMVPGSCVAASQTFTNGGTTPTGVNNAWSGQPRTQDVVSNQVLSITTQDTALNTKFQIRCNPLNNPTVPITAQVCMGIDGWSFPNSVCSAGNSINRPPGYKEI